MDRYDFLYNNPLYYKNTLKCLKCGKLIKITNERNYVFCYDCKQVTVKNE